MDGIRRNSQWLIVFILFFTVDGWAQSAHQLYFRASYRDVDQVFFDSTKHFFTLPMDYGQFEINELPEAKEISRLQIDSVQLVYTDHPKNFDFSKLNTNRIEQFTHWFDGSIDDPIIRWRIIRQTKGETKADFEAMFHGIVAYYSLRPRKPLLPEQEVIRKKNIDKKFEHLVKKKLKVEDELIHITSEVFEKNRDNWNKAVIVSDWTGSMYPYTIDLLSWLIKERAQDQVIGFVFFNDGDTKITSQKSIGKTGGIYTIRDSRVIPVFNLMTKVKNNGDGGDLPENDIEAIINAQNEFKDGNTFILVADNNSVIRDLSLISQVKHPIEIILNRADLNSKGLPIVLKDYVDLALKTSGSIYVEGQEFKSRKALLSLPTKRLTNQ
ncbi:hypothetical protein [Flammeovirga sp. EKP202]|uniref:hypothetical protein n=1 Tax=Flammeovirga sp. EKP202 TaxID=2770592 RepID=UPI00165F01B5|nr:hypothetical protein [Flammeovirga sp. EKP202]MBD0401266.1 hypothetical protein [Flammeovirga sp. EKP202]